MSRRTLSLEQIFDAHLRVLATTLRPHTVRNYRSATHRFLAYLHTAFPEVCKLSQLRRDPISWAGSARCAIKTLPCALNAACII